MILLVDLSQSEENAMYVPLLKKVLKRSKVAFHVVKTVKDLPKTNVKVTGVIISGSPLRIVDVDMSKVNTALYCHFKYSDVPTVGICFGCQLLNVIYGGTVKPFGRFFCGYSSISTGCKGWFCFNDMLDKIAIGFKVKGTTTIDGRTIPCIIQKDNITGIVFHPEYDDNCMLLHKYLTKKCILK